MVCRRVLNNSDVATEVIYVPISQTFVLFIWWIQHTKQNSTLMS